MARGWESKAVEEQVKEFQVKEKGNPRMPLTPAQAEVHRRREVLLLSRARVQRDLQSSQDPRYREQLQNALADLNARLFELPDVL